ncbi:hypothetical protein K437DRAFT_258006 [Tilletiaria anomala UBC 951]|uniref:Uncharacterized protein n=1 Tax=Tilletiaria anomala (strain ATCC 24038 / CBS 436.72 / UBC 951) TaxID=1037660 RepID=A0A066VU31_TILAU|nr:uncharacterized protein K437DRAFT_258006 [Tilletiaria anomala UBC 951]KDN42075.1 hypothetical protein K437DRAFT_258006 [Tilletiaria anomala UBC 951]
MARQPCCCIPNRGAVASLSLIAIIIATLFLAGTFVIISTNAMNTPLVIPAVIFGFTNLLLFVASWVGFFGAILRKRRAVAFYAVVLTILWVCTFIIGLWNVVVVFKNRGMVIDSCVAKSYAQAHGGPFDSKTSKDDCTHAHNILASVIVSVWVVYQLLDLWFITVVYALRRDLIEKDMQEKRFLEQSYVVNSGAAAYRPGSSSRTSEESKMSARSGQAVSVPYRPTGGRQPMGPYVSAAHPAGVPAASAADTSEKKTTDARDIGSAPDSISTTKTSGQAKRMSMGRTINITIEQDTDWQHEPTPTSHYQDAPLSAQPGSIFQSRYDQRYG